MDRLYKKRGRDGELGRIWWCWFYNPAKERVRASTRCTDRRAALLVAARLEREAADPRHRAANETRIGVAIERLLIDRTQRGRAEGTVEMYATKGSHLERVLGADTPLARLTPALVDRFIATRLTEGAVRNTIGKELTTLRAALKLAKRRGELVLDVGAIMPVQWASGYKPRTGVLRRASDLQRLVDHLGERGQRVAFIIATGARWAESDRARREDVDLERGLVRLRGTKTAGADAQVPIVGWMRPLLEMVVAELGHRTGPLFAPWTNVGRDLPAACEALGLDPLTPNDLRRTTATWLRVQGVEPSIVAAVLRHADSRMVERVYGRIAPGAIGDIIARRLGEPVRADADLARGAIAALGSLLGWGDTGVPESRGVCGPGGPRGLVKQAESVPRDGIEPPTRGFSIRPAPARVVGKRRPGRVEEVRAVTPAGQRRAGAA